MGCAKRCGLAQSAAKRLIKNKANKILSLHIKIIKVNCWGGIRLE